MWALVSTAGNSHQVSPFHIKLAPNSPFHGAEADREGQTCRCREANALTDKPIQPTYIRRYGPTEKCVISSYSGHVQNSAELSIWNNAQRTCLHTEPQIASFLISALPWLLYFLSLSLYYFFSTFFFLWHVMFKNLSHVVQENKK